MNGARVWWIAASVLAVGACSEVTTSGGGPVTIELTAATTTAPVGQAVQFTFAATGTSLNGVIVAYGDGAVDSVAAFGAQSAGGVLEHAYEEAGQYDVLGTAEDAVLGNATSALTLTITPP